MFIITIHAIAVLLRHLPEVSPDVISRDDGSSTSGGDVSYQYVECGGLTSTYTTIQNKMNVRSVRRTSVVNRAIHTLFHNACTYIVDVHVYSNTTCTIDS